MDLTERVTIKLTHPNPLFEKWLIEWRDKAIENNSKMQKCFNTALESLRMYPLPLQSGRDCIILKGFGKKLCKMLDDKLDKDKESGTEDNLMDTAERKTPVKKRTSTGYIPTIRSGAYAILITLYKKSLEPQFQGYMHKKDIIKEGTHLCDKSFVKPDPGNFYTAWSSMKTLIDKELVLKKSSPAKYSLSRDGVTLAQKLYNHEMDENNLKGNDNFEALSLSKEFKNKLEPQMLMDNNTKIDDETTAVSSQEETFIFLPYSFDIVLLVDKQEVPGSTRNLDDPLLIDLVRHNVMYELRHLKVGDYAWICRQKTSNQELILPYIVERKRMDDFGSSIKDGRFHEQKFRLKQSGIQNLIYLIESHGSNTHVGLPLSNLYQAATNTFVQDNFSVKFTNELKGTVEYLASLTSILQKFYKDKTLVSCPKQNIAESNIGDDLIPLMSFAEFNKSSSKSHNFKVKELFIRQLLQLKGMSVEKALAIVEKYPTPLLLYRAYQNISQSCDENLLANLQYGKLNKKIGPVISKVVHKLFTSMY
ncbi:hypothetical protein FQA39_LY10617 [Lamprigera yunnana]|nr:hypothetical protein FQA39_LY10617 [Lamprigera yunnana]